MRFGYNNDKWPLIVLSCAGSPKSESELMSMLEGWSNIYKLSEEKKTRFKFVIDVRDVSGIDIKYLIMISKFLNENKKLTERWMDRTAILVSSNNIKFFIKFVFKIYKPVRPFKVFGKNDTKECFDWVVSNNQGDDEGEINKLKDKKVIVNSSVKF